jgi:two-component system chemotaxis response regulator CheY
MAATILSVDDSASMRQMVGFTLKQAGFEVIEAADGVDALEYARDHSVNLVLIDVNMPRMDGILLVRELRQLPLYKFITMLVLTTEAGADKKMQGKQAGATGPSYATGLSGRTRDSSPRQLPTNHDHDGESWHSIHDYQSDQPSTTATPAAVPWCLVEILR